MYCLRNTVKASGLMRVCIRNSFVDYACGLDMIKGNAFVSRFSYTVEPILRRCNENRKLMMA